MRVISKPSGPVVTKNAEARVTKQREADSRTPVSKEDKIDNSCMYDVRKTRSATLLHSPGPEGSDGFLLHWDLDNKVQGVSK